MNLAIPRQLLGHVGLGGRRRLLVAAATPFFPLRYLLSSISDRLNFHQPHENPAEAAGPGIAETLSDVGNALV